MPAGIPDDYHASKQPNLDLVNKRIDEIAAIVANRKSNAPNSQTPKKKKDKPKSYPNAGTSPKPEEA